MAIKITSGGALQRMQNAITQANMALDHNMPPGMKDAWQRTMADMYRIRKSAITINENREAIKNGKI